MITKFAKQLNGVGHFAQIEFDVSQSNKPTHIVIDKCNWKNSREIYKSFILTENLLNYKTCVLEGMSFAFKKIRSNTFYEVNLLDIIPLNTDSSITSMFIVGVISVFEGLNTKTSDIDRRVIDRFVSENYLKNNFSNLSELNISNYKI